MEPLPLLLCGREEPWLSAEVRRLLAGAGLRAQFTFVDECPPDSPGCVVATDDLAGVQLQRTLHRCVRRIRGKVIVVLAFDDPLQALELLGIPFVRACFPLRDPATAAAALADLASSMAPPTVDRRFADRLAVGLRFALRRSRDAHGSPPPRSVAELARQIGCRPETLYRAAAVHGLPLTDILLVSCGRWLLLRLRNVGGGASSRGSWASIRPGAFVAS